MLLLLAWLPFCIVQFLKFSDISYCSWNLADALSLCVTYANGALNVVVYWWSDGDFRKNVRKMIKCVSANDEDSYSTFFYGNRGDRWSTSKC